MKRCLLLATTAVMILAFATPALAVKGKGGGSGSSGGKGKTGTMSIQVRSSIVRTTPNYLGQAAGTLSYGQQVEVTGEQGNWYQIAQPTGWLPKSDLTSHKVAINPDQKFSGSDRKHDEVALAGKGFNPQVEQQFRKDNPGLARAFADVDRVETFSVSEGQLKAFRTSGKLMPK